MTQFEEYSIVSVGDDIPDFTMETYEASTGKFGSVSLSKLKTKGKKKGKNTQFFLIFWGKIL